MPNGNINSKKGAIHSSSKHCNIFCDDATVLHGLQPPVIINNKCAKTIYIPHLSLGWNDFIKKIPKGSIALDGFVKERTIILDPNDESFFNFDHHIGNRELIRSTCSQVYLFLTSNLFSERYGKEKIIPTTYINHLDGDSILSSYLIANYKKYENFHDKNVPIIKKIIDIEDEIDRSGGIYKGDFEDKYFLILNWCLEPLCYDIEDSEKILTIFKRFELAEEGHGKELPPQHDFKFINEIFPRIPESQFFHFITEESPFTRSYLYKQRQKDAFISLKETLINKKNKTYIYSIGKLSENSNFPIKDISSILNNAEKYFQNDKISESNKWGANNLIGGSPYQTQSMLSPALISEIVDNYIKIKGDALSDTKESFLCQNLPLIIKKYIN